MIEILVFITKGSVVSSILMNKVKSKYDTDNINYYYTNNNNYLLSMYNIKKIPSAIVLQDDEEIDRF